MKDDAAGRPLQVFISVVFTDEQEAAVRAAMKKYDITWPDLTSIDNPDYYKWPYQVRLVFTRREIRGDDNYADWAPGDVFVDEDDPHGQEFTATEVDQDYQRVEFTDPEQGAAFARMQNIRRIKRGKR